MREREQIIRDFIVAELMKRGFSIKDVAVNIGKSSSAVQQVVRGWTSTASIRKEIIKIIGKNPWILFPPQEYKIEKSEVANTSD